MRRPQSFRSWLLASLSGVLLLLPAALGQPAGFLTRISAPDVDINTTNVTSVPLESQGLLLEIWNNIPGTNLAALTRDPRFQTNAPDVRILATAADTQTAFVETARENFGARLSGFVVPAESGRYDFFLRSKDAAELWLSPNESEANLARIAAESTCCHDFLEPGAPETSASIVLIGGRRYAIQILLKAGAAGGYAQVALRKEGDPTPAADLRPIPGELLGTQWDVTGGAPIMTTRPHGTTVALGSTGQLNAEVLIGDQPLSYQWSLAGTNIAGATNTSLIITNFAVTNTGLYTLTVTNAVGSASALAGLFPIGSLYIEAEDFNFGHGQSVTNAAIGMGGFYRGDAYRGLGSALDQGIDWHATGGTNEFYRPQTGIIADQENQQIDWFPRADFQVQINNVVLSHAGEWLNYTRLFPAPNEYYLLGRFASTNPIVVQIDEVTTGASTTNQALKKLGQFRPGHATGSSTNYQFFPLVDPSGKLVTLTNWGGQKSFRATVLTNSGQNLDYFMFVPVISEVGPGGSFTSVTRTGTNLVLTWSSGTLESADSPTGPWTSVSGVTSPATIPLIGAKKFYRVRPSPVTNPTFTSVTARNGNLILIWSSGTLESADSLTGPWTPLPALTSPATIPTVGAKKFYRLRPGAVTTTPAFTSVTARNGNLILTWNSGTIESADSLAGPWTPLPALTSPATIPTVGAKKFYRLRPGAVTSTPAFTSVTAKSGSLVLAWTSGTLESADTLAGPWTPLTGAVSPLTVPTTGPRKFYRVR